MLNKYIKEILRKSGIDAKRYSVAQNAGARLIKTIETFEIDTVIDIGANTGQFAEELRKEKYLGNIFSFEPLEYAHNILKQKAKSDNKWMIIERCALSDSTGVDTINVSKNGASSSIFKINSTHTTAAPESQLIGQETIKKLRLDDTWPEIAPAKGNLFIKIDTQGYEYNVIKGGEKTVKTAKVIQTELSLTELYTGQKLFLEMLNYVQDLGFTIWGLEPAFVDSNTGQILQVDATFRNVTA